jgi:phosphate transport system permease protein
MPGPATSPRTERTRLAVAGARATTESRFGQRSGRDKVGNLLFVALLLLGLGTALVALSAIVLWAFFRGRPMLSLDLLTNNPSTVNPRNAGYRPAIIGSAYLIGGVVFLIVPLGLGAAVYLEEFADRSKWWNRVIELNIQNLAGVPSIVFGILGLAFIVRGPISLGFVVAAGSITLALLVLPTVILASREAIRAVPPSIRDGSLALGATQLQTVRKQVIPAALPGILTGVILAVARAIGEAAPLLLVGAVTFVTFDPSFFEGGYSAMPVQIFQYAGRPQEDFRILAAAGVIVLLLVLLVMNSVAIWLRSHYERDW